MFEKLKSELEQRGITPYRLAKLSGIHPTDLYQVLNGNRPMYPGYKKRISEALGVTEAELFEDTTQMDEATAKMNDVNNHLEEVKRLMSELFSISLHSEPDVSEVVGKFFKEFDEKIGIKDKGVVADTNTLPIE